MAPQHSGRQAGRQAQAQAPRKPNKAELRQQKRKRGHDDLQKIEAAIADLDPKAGNAKTFADLSVAVSQATSSGLQASHFTTMTEIQGQAIPLALKGNDILGAAKTGSGKTLAFLVPVLEKLYRAQWTELDGLGALILSPTRELAVQIFEVLRKIGRYHSFSAGLIIGGKSLKEEAERLDRMNILVCTPGRMLQHLDQTAGFDANNLQILVLDEADRIMDLGFKTAVDALIEHLPRERQTLMFSATQSKKVSDLARLSLKDPEYVSVHQDASAATPTSLQQHYIVTPLHEKLDTLYGFLKANVKSKIIVFLSSGKQVRFVYESFRHLQPGIPLLHLHGRQKQVARLEITSRFTAAKQSCLFATDVVARGIDFPAVDWVIQADCPEDADTYIHRVGRTARYESNGRAVLFLDPSEEAGMVARLQQRKIPIQKVHVKEKKKKSIRNNLQNMCFQFPDLKYLGQKAFISYTRSVHLQKDKDVFRFDGLDLDAFAASLGLPGTPQIRFHKGEDIKRIKNAPRQAMSSDSESDMDLDGPKKPAKKPEVRTKYDRMFERTNQDVLSSHYSKLVVSEDPKTPSATGTKGNSQQNDNNNDNDNNDDDDFLSVKRRLNDADLDAIAGNAPSNPAAKALALGGDELYVVDSKRREKALQSKKKMLKFKGNPSKLVFDDDGVAHEIYELVDEDGFRELGPADELRRRFVEEEGKRVKEADLDDKAAAKQRKREKKEKRKARELAEMNGHDSGAPHRDGDDDDDDDGGEDPLALLRSLPVVGGRAPVDEDGDEEEEEEERPAKKPKKWFQDDSDDEAEKKRKKSGKKGKKGGKVIEVDEQPETLEDWEALAAGLLDT